MIEDRPGTDLSFIICRSTPVIGQMARKLAEYKDLTGCQPSEGGSMEIRTYD